MAEQVVTLVVDQPGPGADAARERLEGQLGDAEVAAPDPQTGAFDVTLECDSREQALETVWNAIAAAGADDAIVFAEHPDVPEHWRTRSA